MDLAESGGQHDIQMSLQPASSKRPTLTPDKQPNLRYGCRMLWAGFTGSLLLLAGGWAAPTQLSKPQFYQGMCDASAALALDPHHFVVANDEDNHLRVYHRDSPGRPITSFDLSSTLEIDYRSLEADIEGAARIGQRIYWITSHARNRTGEVRFNRHAFFATDFQVNNGKIQMNLAGRPFRGLLRNLVNDRRFARFQLDTASRREPREKGGFNIEGLCARADGTLLIAFRNPVPDKKALLIPILNPADMLGGKMPRFDDPILLDLDERGIREIVFHEGRFLIVAGSPDGSGKSKLFTWDGNPKSNPQPMPRIDLKDINPEAIVVYPDAGWTRFQLLSDDGSRRRKGVRCKDLADSQKRFRAVWIE